MKKSIYLCSGLICFIATSNISYAVPAYCTANSPPPVADVCPDVNSITISNTTATAPNGWSGTSKVPNLSTIVAITMYRFSDTMVYCGYQNSNLTEVITLGKNEPSAPGVTWPNQGYVFFDTTDPRRPCDYANAFLLNCFINRADNNSGNNKSCYMYDHRPCDPPAGGTQCAPSLLHK